MIHKYDIRNVLPDSAFKFHFVDMRRFPQLLHHFWSTIKHCTRNAAWSTNDYNGTLYYQVVVSLTERARINNLQHHLVAPAKDAAMTSYPVNDHEMVHDISTTACVIAQCSVIPQITPFFPAVSSLTLPSSRLFISTPSGAKISKKCCSLVNLYTNK